MDSLQKGTVSADADDKFCIFGKLSGHGIAFIYQLFCKFKKS